MPKNTDLPPEPIHSGAQSSQIEQANLQVLPPVELKNVFSSVVRDHRSSGIRPSGMDMIHAVTRSLEDQRDEAKQRLHKAEEETSKLRELLEVERREHAVCKETLTSVRGTHRLKTLIIAIGSAVAAACVPVLIVTPNAGWAWVGAVLGIGLVLAPLVSRSPSKLP